METAIAAAPTLRDYAWLVVNSSAGKDSQAMLDVVAQQAKSEEVLDRLVVVHADLGRVEWPGTRELAELQARPYGFRFEVVSVSRETCSTTSRKADAGLLLLSTPARLTLNVGRSRHCSRG